jgi:hypothetical protein
MKLKKLELLYGDSKDINTISLFDELQKFRNLTHLTLDLFDLDIFFSNTTNSLPMLESLTIQNPYRIT